SAFHLLQTQPTGTAATGCYVADAPDALTSPVLGASSSIDIRVLERVMRTPGSGAKPVTPLACTIPQTIRCAPLTQPWSVAITYTGPEMAPISSSATQRILSNAVG